MTAPTTIKTPGVYINEANAFPNSVVEVATAVPAFIGYTCFARNNGEALTNTAVKISSLAEFETMFGKGVGSAMLFTTGTPSVAPPCAIEPVVNLNGAFLTVKAAAPVFYLYNCIRLFFLNGGGSCYIISVGSYAGPIQLNDFTTGLGILKTEQEPTVLLLPDALSLSHDDYYTLMQAALTQCQAAQSLITIADIYNGAAIANPALIGSGANDPIADFRANIGASALDYGAAYFPWLNTTIIESGEITFTNFPGFVTFIEQDAATQTALNTINTNLVTPATAAVKADPYYLNNATLASVNTAHNALLTLSPNYTLLMATATAVANVLPPAAAIAGVYTEVDNTRGVWKAPANIGLAGVTTPTIPINDQVQAGLNVSPNDGKSINAIRLFAGQGVLVWGARTLDGSGNDWRYINIRRTMIMIEQSLKLAARAYVFQPNTAVTWAAVKLMFENFLTNLWRQGALMGAKPEDAYSVNIGLGTTMTADDILNGVMKVTVGVALSRPAEFTIIAFEQQMQKS